MVEKWIGEFKRSYTSTNEAERSGRPKDVTTPQIIEKIDDIILDDQKVKVLELSVAAGIPIGSLVNILHEDLGMRKLTAKWVPCLLIIDQKRYRVRDSKSYLDLFKCNPIDFSRRIVTIDETWIHHFTPESKQQAKQWVGPSGTAQKQADTTIVCKNYDFCFLRF